MPTNNKWYIAESGWYLLALPAETTVFNFLNDKGYDDKVLIIKNVLYLSNSSFTDSQNVISSSPSLGFIKNDNWNILNNHEINNRIFNVDLGIWVEIEIQNNIINTCSNCLNISSDNFEMLFDCYKFSKQNLGIEINGWVINKLISTINSKNIGNLNGNQNNLVETNILYSGTLIFETSLFVNIVFDNFGGGVISYNNNNKYDYYILKSFI